MVLQLGKDVAESIAEGDVFPRHFFNLKLIYRNIMSTDKKKKTARRRCCNQKGGGASDYSGLFHAWGADPAQLSRFTLKNIDKSPIFHPFSTTAQFPTPSDGVIPTGSYYLDVMHSSMHGGGRKSNPWIDHVKKYASEHGMTYPQPQRSHDQAQLQEMKLGGASSSPTAMLRSNAPHNPPPRSTSTKRS